MAYNKETINQAIKLMAKNNSISEISTMLNISPSTLYRWKSKYENEIIELQESVETSKQIRELIKARKYQEALALSEESRFENDFPIQSQRIAILIKLGELAEAITLSEESRFENNFPIQSQRIAILIKLGKLAEALTLSEESRFENNFPIQSQRIAILMKQDRLDKALTLSADPRFENNFPIQSQRITVLMKQGRLDEALALSEESRFENNFPIQSQRITILMKQGRLDEALGLSKDPRFANFFSIQSQKAKIIKLMKNSQLDKVPSTISDNTNILLSSIVNSSCNEDDITNSDIEEWQKVVLTIALYEKNNYPINLIIRYLKRQNVIYQNNASVLGIIKKLLARSKMKKKMFSKDFYSELLRSIVVNTPQEKDYLLNIVDNIISKNTNLSEDDTPPSR